MELKVLTDSVRYYCLTDVNSRQNNNYVSPFTSVNIKLEAYNIYCTLIPWSTRSKKSSLIGLKK